MAKIINFHEITDPKWFENTIQLLLSMYSPCKMEDIQAFYQGNKLNKNSFHITVDDGCLSDYTTIYPILKKYNLQATIFVSPYIAKTENNFWFQEIQGYDQEKIRGIIADKFDLKEEIIQNFYPNSMLKNMQIHDILEIISIYQKKYNEPKRPRRNMNVKELLELKNSGHFVIGAHTQTHPILANETDRNSQKEIKGSVVELSDILNEPVNIFAYPNGKIGLDYGEREMITLRANLIEYAFSFDFKNIRKKDKHLNIPRFGLSHGSTSIIKKKLIIGEYWESIKNALFNNENKHRQLIKSKVCFF